MPLPALIPILGSIAGTLAGPGIGAGVVSALGLGGTAAGSLIAAAAPKAIGAGIASLAAGASVPDAVQQVMQAQPRMGAGGGQGVAPGSAMFAPPPPTSVPAAYSPAQPLQSVAPSMGMGMSMGGPQPQPQQQMQGPAGMPSPTQILAPQPQAQMPQMLQMGPQQPSQPPSLGVGLGALRGRSGPAMPPMMKGFV